VVEEEPAIVEAEEPKTEETSEETAKE